jgi:RNA polymerase sigma-70 factor (ECF subfamily)
MASSTPHTAPDEDELLARAKKSDPAACRAIVEAHQRAVFAQLRGMLAPVGRGAAVEDLAQDTFLRAFRALHRFEGSSARLRAWLVTIATRVALNALRQSRVRVEDLDTVAERVAAKSGDPRCDGCVVGRGIASAIGELPDTFRAAFLLRELHGLDYAEIATTLDVDLGTVKSRLSRARARLRAALSDPNVESGRRPRPTSPLRNEVNNGG